MGEASPFPPAAAPRKSGLFAWLSMLAAGIVLFLAICAWGERLEAPPAAEHAPAARTGVEEHADVVRHVLATLAAIIALGYVLGRALRWIGQPPVIGEVLAGVVLGPSVLAAWWPEAAHFLIPSAQSDPAGTVHAALLAISRLGIVFYMFLVGLELNLPQLRLRARAVALVSQASIVVPFLLGAGLTLWLYPRLSTDDVSFTSLALFMGVAMAITAFPVLARILTDQKLEKTELGLLGLSAAAAGDVTAWCLLAVVVGTAESQLGEAVGVLAGAVIYTAVMFAALRPLVTRIARRAEAGEAPWMFPTIVVMVLLSALVTKLIGIHSLFGGFALGAVMPHDGRLAAQLRSKLHDMSTVLLLPAFFAITGLRTDFALLAGLGDWLVAGAIILVATIGKVGGTVAAARFVGIDWRSSAALGMLMNTRGLMELIALNLGLEIGVISPTLFAMMVLMALVTTLMTAPAVRWLLPAGADANAAGGPPGGARRRPLAEGVGGA